VTVTIRNPLIRTPRATTDAVAGAASARRTTAGRQARRTVPVTPARRAATAAAPAVGRSTVAVPGTATPRRLSTAGTAARTVALPASARAVGQASVPVAGRLRRSPRYRYSLATIDVMFASVAEAPEAERALDRWDRRAGLYALLIGLAVVVAASIGAAIILAQLASMLSSFTG